MSRDFKFPGNKSPKETFFSVLICGGKSSKKKSCGQRHEASWILILPDQVQGIRKWKLWMAHRWKLIWKHVWSPKFWYILFLLGERCKVESKSCTRNNRQNPKQTNKQTAGFWPLSPVQLIVNNSSSNIDITCRPQPISQWLEQSTEYCFGRVYLKF